MTRDAVIIGNVVGHSEQLEQK